MVFHKKDSGNWFHFAVFYKINIAKKKSFSNVSCIVFVTLLIRHCNLVKSTSVKKGCTKSKKTPKFGVGAICKIYFFTPSDFIILALIYLYNQLLLNVPTIIILKFFEDGTRAEFWSLFRFWTSLLNWNRL